VAKLKDAEALFLHQLQEMLYVERTLADEVLPKLKKEVRDERLRDGIQAHVEQTKEQARNVEKAFELLGQPAEQQPSPALDGLEKAHDQLVSDIADTGLRDFFDAEAAAKTEHLEIASYRGLITMAEQMGQTEVRDLLATNCKQEEQTLAQLEDVSEKLSRELVHA
jgi:ferritin-like metal-binding protein YciE